MNGLAEKTEFDDWRSFLDAKKAYEDSSKTVLVTRGSHKLKGNNETAEKFCYDRKIYECKAGGQRQTQSNGQRSSSTYKMNCPVMVKVEFNGNKLIVTESKLDHLNHLLDQQTYDHYPENMRLTAEQGERAKKMISVGGNKKLIKMDLMKERGGKPVMMHNYQTQMQNEKRQNTGNELQQLYDILTTIPGAKVRFISNEDDEFVGIYYQDERMLQLYDKYPEVVLFDGSYKLNNLNFGLFIQLCIDSNGETEVVSLYICRNETREGIGAMLATFKEFNPNWYKSKVFIGDKDFADRSVYNEYFPGCVLQICLFHVLQIFNREITTTKREITTEQRNAALEILQRLAYSESRHSYNEIYDELCDLGLEHVTSYFDDNWHNIKDEWTLFGRNQHAHFLNVTNNRSERLNRTIKELGNRNANLLVFFGNLSTTVAVLASEKDIKAVRSRMRVERKRFDDPALERYHQLLTPFIYKKVEQQYKFCDELTIELTQTGDGIFESQSGYTVTKDFCSCTVFKALNIPCRHIFKLLKNQELDLFLPALCLHRWTKQYYHQSHPALISSSGVAHRPPQPISVQTIKAPAEVSKYKKAAAVTKEINNLASTMSSGQYNFFMEQLVTLKNNMLNPNEENADIPSAEQSNPSSATATRVASHTAGTTATSSQNVGTGGSVITSNSEAGPANQLVSKHSRNDVASIKLPQKNAPKGRPKGKVNTVVGLKRKSQSNVDCEPTPVKKKKFLDLNLKNQSLNIISWLTNKTADQILTKKTARHDIIEDSTMFNRLRNDGLTFADTKKYFQTQAYKYVCEEVEKLNGKPWQCVKCSRNLAGDQVMCHSCLDWYHVKCVNYDTKNNPDFFCNDCKTTSALIDL